MKHTRAVMIMCLLACTLSSCEPRMFSFKILDLTKQEKFTFECTPNSEYVFSTLIKVKGNVDGNAELAIHINQYREGRPLWPSKKLRGEIDLEIKSEWYSGDRMILVVKADTLTEGHLKITCYF